MPLTLAERWNTRAEKYRRGVEKVYKQKMKLWRLGVEQGGGEWAGGLKRIDRERRRRRRKEERKKGRERKRNEKNTLIAYFSLYNHNSYRNSTII